MGYGGAGETRRRVIQAVVVVVVGVGVGLAVGGIPDRSRDAPLRLTGATTTTTSAEPAPVAAPAVVPPRAPAAVNVLALNASGVAGVALRVGERLRAAGYNVSPPAQNPRRQPSARVLYRPGFADEAAAVAEVLGLAPEVLAPAPADGAPADVVVMVGEDLARRG